MTSFSYWPRRDGVSEAASSLATEMAQRGHEVCAVTGRYADEPEEEVLSGVRVVRFSLKYNLPPELQPVMEKQRFVAFVQNFGADLLVNHCWDTWPSQLIFKYASGVPAKRVQVSHGLTRHLWTRYSRFPWGLGEWIRGIDWTACSMPQMIRWYDAVVLLSKQKDVKRFFDHALVRLLKHKGVHVIPNHTDPEKFLHCDCDFRSRHRLATGPLVLCVANYSDGKNQALTVEAFRRAHVTNSTLVLIGSEINDYAKGVQARDAVLAKQFPNCKVVFLERLSRQETLGAFAGSDLFLLTSNAETQPIVLIEAMAAGKPWISTPRGCIPLMEGGLVARGAKEIACEIRRVLSDRDLYDRLAQAGRQAAQDTYSTPKIMSRWEHLFLSLVERG